MNCVICGTAMDSVLAPAVTHPNCGAQFGEPHDRDPFNVMLKDRLTEIITWADAQNPRGHQVLIGPSEIGDVCDRRIGYRLAQVEACNVGVDPWASIVGTATHSWLQRAVNAWMEFKGSADWLTETTLAVNEFVEGHADLYWREYRTVIDWKTQSPVVFKKTKEDGPAPGYVIQAHVYGYGFEQSGVPVDRVSLVFLGRSGRLRDMYVWSTPYDRSVAEAAMTRMYGIAHRLVFLDVLKQSHRWEQVDAIPTDSCGLCSWYNPLKEPDAGADDQGCPGR